VPNKNLALFNPESYVNVNFVYIIENKSRMT